MRRSHADFIGKLLLFFVFFYPPDPFDVTIARLRFIAKKT